MRRVTDSSLPTWLSVTLKMAQKALNTLPNYDISSVVPIKYHVGLNLLRKSYDCATIDE